MVVLIPPEERIMTLDLDTFLTALYTTVDDLYREKVMGLFPKRPGPAPRLSDSEMLTLGILAQWHPFTSERAFWRWAQAHLRPYFPGLCSQSRFNRRLRSLWQGMASVYHNAALQVAKFSAYRVVDATPVPVCKLPRFSRSVFRGQAAMSWCDAKKEWYFGFKLMLSVTPQGVITSAAMLPANLGDRPGAESIWQQERHPCYLADKGFCSVKWEEYWWETYGVRVLAAPFTRHKRAWPKELYRQMSRRRKIVEVVINLLKDGFGLERHRAKTQTGLHARVGAKLAAYTLGQWLNQTYQRPLRALATLCSW